MSLQMATRSTRIAGNGHGPQDSGESYLEGSPTMSTRAKRGGGVRHQAGLEDGAGVEDTVSSLQASCSQD